MTDPHNQPPAPSINHIAPELRSLVRRLDALLLDPKNVRLHAEGSIRAIAESLATFGQQKPIVIDPDGLVLAGNGTLLAAASLGWTELACSVMEGSIASQRAYAIADNRLAELSEWHRPRVVQQMTQLYDAAPDLAVATHFTDGDIAAMRVQLENDAARLAAGALANAGSVPPIAETIAFDAPSTKATVEAFLRALGRSYPDTPTAGSRLVAFLRDRGDVPRPDAPQPA